MTLAALALTVTMFVPMWFYAPPTVSEKRGLANAYWQHADDCKAVGTIWQYFWSPFVPLVDGCEGVPMIWDETQMNFTVGGNSPWLMGFNEPDVCPDQACMTPDEAAVLWHTIEIGHTEKLLVSPAILFDELWLDNFRNDYHAQYGDWPRLDALAVHCYKQTSDECIEWVNRFIAKADEWGIPEIWVTEFSFVNIQELEAFVAWMEANPRVTRYAYFTNRSSPELQWHMPLLDDDSLTPYGMAYSR